MLWSLDCETELIEGMGAKIRTRFHVPRLACVSYCNGSVCDVTAVDTPEREHALRVLLTRILESDDEIAAHNAAFDIAVLAKHFGMEQEWRAAIAAGRVLDTRVLHALRFPDLDGSRVLAACARGVLGVDLEKGDVRTSFVPGQPLTAEQAAYAKQDAQVTYDLAKALLDIPYGGLSPRPPHFRAFQIYAEETGTVSPDRLFSSAAAWMAFNLEPVGLGVSRERLAELHDEYTRLEDEHLKLLRGHGFAELVREPRAVPYTIEHRGAPPPRKWTPDVLNNRMIRTWKGRTEAVGAVVKIPQTKLREEFARVADALGLHAAAPGQVPVEGQYPVSESGQLSLDAKFWKPYREELPSGLQEYLALGKVRKLLGTYFRPLMETGADRVYAHYMVGFAQTGRWSCFRPNLQNQPKKIRDLYVPAEGHVFVSADYKSLELYCACEAFHRLGLGGGPLRQVLDAGGDVHRNTAALLFRKPAEEVTDDERQTAKIANFSLLGGLGPKKFRRMAIQAGLDWSLEQAADVRDRWFSAMTDCAEFLQLFRVDPWQAMPDGWRKAAWLDLNGVPSDPWPSKWELQRGLADGAVYEVRLPSGRVVPNRRFSQAANCYFQGIGAEVITLAFTSLCAAGLEVAAVVHDSVTLQAPKERAQWAAGKLETILAEAEGAVCSCGVAIPVPEVLVSEVWS